MIRCEYPGCRSAATRACDHCGVRCCAEHGETGEGSGCTLRPLAASPADLVAENAALREALAASGELLAEAHAEVKRLRGAG